MSTMPQWDRLSWDARRRHVAILEHTERALEGRIEEARTQARAALNRRDEVLQEVALLTEQAADLQAFIARLGEAIPIDIEGRDRLRAATNEIYRRTA